LLKSLGEKHELYDFVSILSVRCSYLLVNKEYVKEILSEASEHKSSGNTKLISSCMNLLTVYFAEAVFLFLMQHLVIFFSAVMNKKKTTWFSSCLNRLCVAYILLPKGEQLLTKKTRSKQLFLSADFL
jgi:hypothetical protein